MDTVSITKQEAASRQLDVAIQLLFAGGDVVGAHTLAGAASTIASFLMEHERPEQSRKLAAREVCGLDENTYRQIMRKMQNFLEHADKDPVDSHDFAVTDTLALLELAVFNLGELTGGLTTAAIGLSTKVFRLQSRCAE